MKCLADLPHPWPVARIALCPRNFRLLTSSADSDANILWDIHDPANPVKIAAFGSGGDVFDRTLAAAFHPKKDIFCITGAGRGIEIRDGHADLIDTWDSCEPRDHNRGYASLAYDAFGEKLFAGRWRDRKTRVFDPSGACIFEYWGNGGEGALALHPSGKIMANAMIEQGGSTLRFAQMAPNIDTRSPEYWLSCDAGAIAFSPDGCYIAAAGGFPPIEADVFSFPDGDRRAEWFGNDDHQPEKPWAHEWGMSLVTGFAFSPDSDFLLLPGADGSIIELDIDAEEPARTWRAHDDVVTTVLLMKENRAVVSASRDGHVKLWNSPYDSEPDDTDIEVPDDFLDGSRSVDPFASESEMDEYDP